MKMFCPPAPDNIFELDHFIALSLFSIECIVIYLCLLGYVALYELHYLCVRNQRSCAFVSRRTRSPLGPVRPAGSYHNNLL